MRLNRIDHCAMGELEIIFEDADLVVVNKPSGMLVEGGGSREEDLEQFVSRVLGRKRVFACHRLDRLTSGVVLLRKTGRFSKELGLLFEKRQTRKEYRAIVSGAWDRKVSRIETQIGPLGKGRWANVESGGKLAVSTVQALEDVRGASYLRILLKTGRTHQARLHCSWAGHPIWGDPVYGRGEADGFFGLHASRLCLAHPGTGEGLELVAPIPEVWDAFLAERRPGAGHHVLG